METVNYQCPACSGPLRFDSAAGTLKCDYCDSQFTAEQVEEYYAAKQGKADEKAARSEASGPQACAQCGTPLGAGAAFCTECGAPVPVAGAAAASDAVVEEHVKREGDDAIAEFLKRSNWDDADSQNLVTNTCSSCGAELVCDKATAVAACPYCGNPTVIPGKMADMLKPDYVVPFKLGREDAIAKLKEYYKGKRFLAKAFREGNHIEEIQGVYVPFWLYDATGHGDATFKATNTQVWDDGEATVTKTDIYHCQRSGSMGFSRVPADGSERMPDAHMDAIEPFDYSEMVPFSIGYLPGYLADRYDVDAAQCQERALGRIGSSVIDQLKDTVTGYATVSVESSDTNIDVTKVSYAMLPVWMLHTKWNGKDFLFAMNGQTGKLIGDLPVSKGQFAAWFSGLTVVLAAAAFAVLALIL